MQKDRRSGFVRKVKDGLWEEIAFGELKMKGNLYNVLEEVEYISKE